MICNCENTARKWSTSHSFDTNRKPHTRYLVCTNCGRRDESMKSQPLWLSSRSRIKTVRGNMLTDVTEGYMIHGCNCQGVMGSGLAKEVRERFPKVYNVYRQEYLDKGLRLGDIQALEIRKEVLLVNCMTQRHYGTEKRHLDYEALAKCIENVNINAKHNAPYIKPVLNFPMIGCGLAGGNWEIVKKIIEECAPDMELVYWEYDG